MWQGEATKWVSTFKKSCIYCNNKCWQILSFKQMKKPWHWKKEGMKQSHLRGIKLLLYYLLWNGNHLIFGFLFCKWEQETCKKRQKGKEEVAQWGEMSIITWLSFLYMWYSETPLLIVSCWQVSDERKKKTKRVSLSNQWFEWIYWGLETMNVTLFQYFTDIGRDNVNGDESEGENDIYLGLAYMIFFIFFLNFCLWIFHQTCNEISNELLVDVSVHSVEAWIFLFISHYLILFVYIF